MCWINNPDLSKYDQKFDFFKNFHLAWNPSILNDYIIWIKVQIQHFISITFNTEVQFFSCNQISNTKINIKFLPEFVN